MKGTFTLTYADETAPPIEFETYAEARSWARKFLFEGVFIRIVRVTRFQRYVGAN